MTPTHDPDAAGTQIGAPVAASLREALAGMKPDRSMKFNLFLADCPMLKVEPTKAEAIQLSLDIRRIRDQVNRLLQKYYHWPDVMNASLHKQLQYLMGAALQYSGTQYDDWSEAERRIMSPEPNDDRPVTFVTKEGV